MTASTGGLAGYVRDQVRPGLEAVGGFVKMCVLTAKALFRRPFQWREFILQGWFLMRVAFLPTIRWMPKGKRPSLGSSTCRTSRMVWPNGRLMPVTIASPWPSFSSAEAKTLRS